MTRTAITRGRLTGEKHTDLGNIKFTWCGSTNEEMKSQRSDKLWIIL